VQQEQRTVACCPSADAELEARLADERAAIALLETIPGVGRRTAEVLVAEIGTDLSRFLKPPSTWLPGPRCVRATLRAMADASVAGHATQNAWLRRTLAEVATICMVRPHRKR
jgi:transposase